MQAKKLAQSGVSAREIRVRLEISQRTYSRWAKAFGFRDCDLRSSATEGRPDLWSANSVLSAVRAALAEDKQAEVDRLIRAWKQTARRGRDLAALESEAAEEVAAQQADADLSNEELSAFLTRYAGRKIDVVD